MQGYIIDIKPVKDDDLIVAILTTTSTTSYLAFSLILLAFSFNMRGFYKIILILFFIPVLYFGFNSIPFLKDKISEQRMIK